MLTPQEISEKEFVKAVFGGYDMSAVDDFLESLTADYSLLYKENAILKSKIKVLVEKVEEYRSTEDAMRMALLTAQKMGDEMMSDAKNKSEAMIKEAEDEVAAKLAEGEKLIKDEEYRLATAKDATQIFIAKSRELLDQHNECLLGLDDLSCPADEATREDEIVDKAREIDTAVSKLVDEEAEEAAAAETAKKTPSPEEVAEALKRAMAGTDLPIPGVDEIVSSYESSKEAESAAFNDDDEPTKVFSVAQEEAADADGTAEAADSNA